MKRLISIFVLLLLACNSTKTTDSLLAGVWEKDQSIRLRLAELTKAVSVEGRTDLIDSLVSVVDEQQRIDEENMAVVDSLLQRGLPAGLSAESYKTIWIVIDHASLEKQEQYLPIVEQMSLEGLIDKDEYAILCDRVAMKQNRPQRYGSQVVQFGSVDALQLYLWPVENPAELDSLRASVVLSPIAEYLSKVSEESGIEVIYEPTITVEEINTMRNK